MAGGVFIYLYQQLQTDNLIPAITNFDKYVGGLGFAGLTFFLIKWLVRRNDKEREYSELKQSQWLERIERINAELLSEKQKDIDEKQREIERLQKKLDH